MPLMSYGFIISGLSHVPDTGPHAGDKEIHLEWSLGRSTAFLVVVVTVGAEEGTLAFLGRNDHSLLCLLSTLCSSHAAMLPPGHSTEIVIQLTKSLVLGFSRETEPTGDR